MTRTPLATLIDEIAVPGWRRDPAWLALYAAVALAERVAPRRAPSYLASDAEPRADTFIGTPGPAPDDAAGRIGWAIAGAHALVRAVIARDGTLPEQPLAVRVVSDGGAARTVAVASPWSVAFAFGDRLHVARLDPRGPGHEVELARTLAAALAGRRLDAGVGGEALAVIALGDDELARAHHGHRRGWDHRGGPWLGLARAGGQTLVSTCHMVVDGHGHALLAGDVARTLDRAAARHLAAAAAAVVGDAPRPPLAPLPPGAGDPLGVAWRRVAAVPSFTTLAWSLGRVLHRDHGHPLAPRSPTFQVPVAPGAPDDPTRFARRVRPAVMSVRFSDGVAEPLTTFAARARGAVAREAAGDGLVGRLLAALAAAPLPLGFKRRSVVGARGGWLRAPIEALAGAGCLSLLRSRDALPSCAVSSPAELLPAGHPRSTSVLTLVVDRDGTTATLAGTGRVGDARHAAAWLDAYLALVADPGGLLPSELCAALLIVTAAVAAAASAAACGHKREPRPPPPPVTRIDPRLTADLTEAMRRAIRAADGARALAADQLEPIDVDLPGLSAADDADLDPDQAAADLAATLQQGMVGLPQPVTAPTVEVIRSEGLAGFPQDRVGAQAASVRDALDQCFATDAGRALLAQGNPITYFVKIDWDPSGNPVVQSYLAAALDRCVSAAVSPVAAPPGSLYWNQGRITP